MSLQEQENIKQKLSKVDELLTKECVLCGDFMLDIIGSSTIPDEPHRPRSLLKIKERQNSYSIDLTTGMEKPISGNEIITLGKKDEWSII